MTASVDINAHYAAFKTLLTADPNGLDVYDAESPKLTTGMYVTLYGDTGNPDQVDLANENPLQVWTIQTTVTGLTVEQANAGMKLVQDRLLGVRLSVPGRACSPIRKLGSRKAERDDDVSPAVFYAVADWRWISTLSA